MRHRLAIALLALGMLVTPGCAETPAGRRCKKLQRLGVRSNDSQCRAFLGSKDAVAVCSASCVDSSATRQAHSECIEKCYPDVDPPKLGWTKDDTLQVTNPGQIKGGIGRRHRLKFSISGSKGALRVEAEGLPRRATLSVAGETFAAQPGKERRGWASIDEHVDLKEQLGELDAALLDYRVFKEKRLDLELPITLKLRRHKPAETKLPPLEAVALRHAIKRQLRQGAALGSAREGEAGVGVLLWSTEADVVGQGKVRDVRWVGVPEEVRTGKSRKCGGVRPVRVYAARTTLRIHEVPGNAVVAEKVFPPGRLTCPQFVYVVKGKAQGQTVGAPRSGVRRWFKGQIARLR